MRNTKGDFHGKVVYITGAASGIGLDLATSFAKEGAKVMMTDLNENKILEEAKALQDEGFEVVGMKCDVTKEQEIKATIQQTIEQFGGIHILINNAGLQHVDNVEDFPTDRFELLIKVMLTAPFITTKLVFPIMKKQRFGRIINMASINGLVGFSGKSAYNSAKHGVIGLTKVVALEGAPYGITVNALARVMWIHRLSGIN